ncbi:UTP--glucose-1-phosphate uridylyltransferase [Estrella lausannensis]|nr:UTP--glucose-1-phosphate uridylyltransferase [Estrella lausannensis]
MDEVADDRLQRAQEKLERMGQTHLLKWWSKLPSVAQDALLQQVEDIDIPLLKRQQAQLAAVTLPVQRSIQPLKSVLRSGDPKLKQEGRKALSEGKVGALIVAGGQGTRLGFDHPKGMYQVTAARRKSLFQLLAEKTKACGMMVNRELPLSIMTSKENEAETKRYFHNNHLFELSESQIGFFTQNSLPLLDTQGRLFLEEKGRIAFGPDGNGSALNCFAKSPLYKAWKESGVRYVVFSLIDNPLADPYDMELVGRAMQTGADVVIKAVERSGTEEKVGILAEVDGKVGVIEYTEFPKDLWNQKGKDRALLYNFANISLFCLSMEFIKKAGEDLFEKMPLHKAFKAVPYLDSFGGVVKPNHPFAWKFERFIFDFLPFAENVEIVVYPRSVCFSPLKNAEGEASPETVKQDLTSLDRSVLRNLFGEEPPQEIVEIAQDFYYPTSDLLERFKGSKLPPSPYLDGYKYL